jgi:superfamily I DNA/RNA helicase
MRVYSSNQVNVFNFCETGKGNAIVEAVAGSGKTTTIVEALKRCTGSTLFLAFNKAIATELSTRGVNARTFHSLCYSPVTRSRGVRSVEADKLRMICRENIGEKTEKAYGAFARKLVSLAKQVGVGCLVEDSEQVWVDIVATHDLEPESEEASISEGIDFARDLLKWSNADARVDFDDLLYFAVKDGVNLSSFSWVFVDEAQDTNAIQRAILRKIMGPFSRMVAVGDPAQAIYGFRGASSDSLKLIADEFDAVTLPLTITYRCASSIVTEARQYVAHIEAADTAPEGEVYRLGSKWDASAFKALDLVVCRTTKPLISLAYKLLKARVPVRIMGREIGEGLKSLVSKMNAKGIDALIEKLNAYAARETEKAKAKHNEAKIEQIQDKVDCVLFLIDSLTETTRTIPALIDVIDSLFADKANAVVLATIHKSKGLEADRVFWLNSSKCPSKWAKQPWQIQQEMNLCYVAITRAKSVLTFIEDEQQPGEM